MDTQQSQPDQAPRPYTSPEITCYGTVDELTQAKMSTSHDHAGSNRRSANMY